MEPSMLGSMRVASFTHWLQGPATGQYLADLGADVIRVEGPGRSYEREWRAAGRDCGGHGTLYLAANRNTRNVVLDLKHPEGVQVARELIASVDVVIENYRPGVMDRLGLGYEAAKALKADIIYASGTGYGPDGPLSAKPGQDLLVQARTGMIAQNGAWGERPTPIGNSAVDQHGATLLALGIVSAYVRKLQTGIGTRVEGSLFTASLDLMQEGLTHYYSCHHDRRSLDRDRHLSSWYLAAPYGVYRLRDAFIAVSINTFAALGDALDSQELRALADVDPFEKRDSCAGALADVLQAMTFAEVKARFDAKGIWYERCRDFDDLRDDPQTTYSQALCQATLSDGTEVTLVNHPIRYDGDVLPFRGMALSPGLHTHEVLSALGHSDARIRDLAAIGAIAVAQEEEGT